MNEQRIVAYFSMEIGVDPAIHTYSGGLGVLAGDTIRSAADLNVPMVAVTLLHRKGYFHQRLDASGWQKEEPAEWVVETSFVEIVEGGMTTAVGIVHRLEAMKRRREMNSASLKGAWKKGWFRR